MPHGSWFPGDPWDIDTLYREQPQSLKDLRRIREFDPETEQELPEEKKKIKPWGRYKRKAYIGIDIGKRSDPTAFAILEPFEPFERRDDKKIVYDCSYVRRIDLETPYPDIARGIAHLDDMLRETGKYDWLYYIIDSGGVGESVIDMVKELLPNTEIWRAYVTGGTLPNVNWELRSIMLPKVLLASTLIMLFESDRVEISSGVDLTIDEIEALQDELYNYELRISEKGNDLYGAFKLGAHDDLASALGMAGWLAEFEYNRGEAVVW